jgi:S1-C subfamily serine protease
MNSKHFVLLVAGFILASDLFNGMAVSQVAVPPTPSIVALGRNANPQPQLTSIPDEVVGVLAGQIDNQRLYRQFLEGGRALTQRAGVLDPKAIAERLLQTKRPASIQLPQVNGLGKLEFSSLAKSSLMFGIVYDCGRCSRLHANIAGGVVISADGLALTNHHVLDRDDKGVMEVFAMTHDGKAHPIVEVLSSDEKQDVALVRLGGEGPFFPAPIASEVPLPLEPTTVLSHPSNQFFVLTQGVVSRHVRSTTRRGVEQWMEITADYAAGSSGSGVFNARGEIIGLVSRNIPLYRKEPPHSVIQGAVDREHKDETEDNPDQKPDEKSEAKRAGKSKKSVVNNSNKSFVEMTLHRCVSLEAIKSCFAK